MALSDLLNQYINKKTDLCPFAQVVDSLSDEDQKVLASAIAKGVPNNYIIQALQSEGKKVSNDSYYNHRRGTCRCPKK